MQDKKHLTIGIIGPTKAGKTATLSFLTKNTAEIQSISSGDRGRTKITMEYHFDPDYDDALFIEKIWYFPVAFAGSQDRTIAKYNDNLDKDAADKRILTDIFKMRKLNEGEDINKYIEDVINGFSNKTADNDMLSKLISTEEIDDYISRIIVKVGPESNFKQYLVDNNLDLSIRDTRGLLDIVIKEDDGKKSIKSTKSITDLGLEGMDGIIFYCYDEYPNITNALYKDILSKLLKSIPIFLLSKDNLFKQAFKMDVNNAEKRIDIDNIKNFITSIQKNQIDMYEDIENNYSATFKLLSNFDITERNDNGNWDFTESYFDVGNVEYVLPKIKNMNDVESTDYNLLKIATISSIELILDNIINLHKTMNAIFENTQNKLYEVLNQVLRDDRIKQQLVDDFNKFDNGPYGYNSPRNTRPVLQEYNTEKLNNDVVDSNVELQGPYGGVTSRNNGRLKYPLTAILGVTASNWMFDIIDNIKIDNMFKRQGLSDEKAINLTKKLLRFVYYRRFIDSRASINGSLIVDRETIIRDVAEIRNMALNQLLINNEAFVTTISKALSEFCIILRSMENIADVYIKEENKK